LRSHRSYFRDLGISDESMSLHLGKPRL
jgi:hypothetical protein